jgi:hypothetical protein
MDKMTRSNSARAAKRDETQNYRGVLTASVGLCILFEAIKDTAGLEASLWVSGIVAVGLLIVGYMLPADQPKSSD